jgi:hypothetical protein
MVPPAGIGSSWEIRIPRANQVASGTAADGKSQICSRSHEEHHRSEGRCLGGSEAVPIWQKLSSTARASMLRPTHGEHSMSTAERVGRRLTAILAADVAGYSRLMGADEEGTLAQLKTHRRALVDPKVSEHRGRSSRPLETACSWSSRV